MKRRNTVTKAQELNDQAVRLAETNQYAEAEALFREAIEIWPEYSGAWDNLGVVLMHQARYSEALMALLRSIALEPNDPNTHFNLALLIGDHGLDLTLDQLQECLRLDPSYPDVHYYLGTIHYGLSEEETALDHFQQALEQNPRDTRSLVWLSRYAFEQGDYEKAISLCQKALDLDPEPSDPEVYIGLGNSYAALEDYEKAEHYFEQYVMANPYDPYGHYLLACVYASENQTDLAIQSLQDAFSLGKERVLEWVAGDPRLESLQRDPRFRRLIGEDED